MPLRVPWLVVPKGLSDVRVNGSRAAYTGSGATRRRASSSGTSGSTRASSMSMPGVSRDDRENVGEVDLRAAGVQSLRHLGVHRRQPTRPIGAWSSPSTPGNPGRTRPRTSSTCSSTSTRTATEDYALFSADDGLVFTGEANGITDAFVLDLGDEPARRCLRQRRVGRWLDHPAARAGQRLWAGQERPGVVRVLRAKLRLPVGQPVHGCDAHR